MHINEFIARSQAALLAFKSATELQAQIDPTFTLDRDELDWWHEVCAYMDFTELEEAFKAGGSN